MGIVSSTLELWNEPNNLLDWDWRLDPDWLKFCTMIGAAAYWARRRGKRVVLGAPCPTDVNWFHMMGERGVLGVVDAIGVHGFPGTWDSVEGGVWSGWHRLIGDVRESLRPHNENLEIWITETGYSTWRHDPFQQVRAFLDAMEAPADRLYWYALRDTPAHVAVQEGTNFDVRHYHLGIHQADGRPKLLGRALADGIPAVRKLAGAQRSMALVGRKSPVLITGGAGFIGCNLADRLAGEGENVLILDSLVRPGVEENLAWLRERHPRRIAAVISDVRDSAALTEAAARRRGGFPPRGTGRGDHQPRRIRPRIFRSTCMGTFRLLEALRRRSTALHLRQHEQGLWQSGRNGAGLRRRRLPARRSRAAPAWLGRDPAARFPHALWLLEGCGGPVCAGLCR